MYFIYIWEKVQQNPTSQVDDSVLHCLYQNYSSIGIVSFSLSSHFPLCFNWTIYNFNIVNIRQGGRDGWIWPGKRLKNLFTAGSFSNSLCTVGSFSVSLMFPEKRVGGSGAKPRISASLDWALRKVNLRTRLFLFIT